MAKKVSFYLDLDAAGRVILQGMVLPVIQSSGDAIAARARSMASSISSNPPSISSSTSIGKIKKGQRAIATVSANFNNAREEYIARQALMKAKDAGRV